MSTVQFYKEENFRVVEADGFKLEVPEEWEVVRLGDVLFLLRNGLTYRQNKDGDGFPISRIETISDEKIDPSKVGFVNNIKPEELEEYRLKTGDILFSHINSLEHIGKTAIYEGTPELLLHGMNLLLLRPNRSKIEPYYLLNLLRFYRAQRIFRSISKKAVNQASINQTQMKNLKIPLPPLPEQQKIAHVLMSIDKAIEAVDEAIKQAERIKKGLMQELLTNGVNLFSLEWQKIINAVKRAYENKDHEFGREENLVSHLAGYLREEFGNYDVDSEVEKDARGHRPDIIIHRRHTNINLFAIEVKKREDANSIKEDIDKLENLMLNQYRYYEAIFIGFNIRNPENVLNLSGKVNFVLVTPEGEIITKTKKREFKDTEIGRIPEEWEVVRLGDVAYEFVSGGTPSTKVAKYWNGGIPWIRSVHITKSYIDENSIEQYITKEGLENSAAKIVPKGNLIIATRVGIGKSAVNLIDVAINQDLTGVVLNKSKIDPFFLVRYFSSPQIVNLLESFSRGTTIRGIPQDYIKNLKIPLPPLPEQQKVAEILSKWDEVIELKKAKKERLERMKKKVMELLLTGKVRVK